LHCDVDIYTPSWNNLPLYADHSRVEVKIIMDKNWTINDLILIKKDLQECELRIPTQAFSFKKVAMIDDLGEFHTNMWFAYINANLNLSSNLIIKQSCVKTCP